MDKESLIKAREIIIKGLDQSKINQQDRTELMINLWNLLEAEDYDHNIDILKRYSKPKKKEGKRKW